MPGDYNFVCPAKQAPVQRMRSCFAQTTPQVVSTIGLVLVLALVLALVLVLAVMMSGVAQAGTGGTEFDAVNNRIVDMVEGGGGKLAAGLGLVAALATSVIRFNIWSVIGAFGVGAMAGYGIPIVTSSVSAII